MMNENWKNFLIAQGATIQDDIVQYFGSGAGELTETRDGLVLCYLSQYGVLKVSGEDAETFCKPG